MPLPESSGNVAEGFGRVLGRKYCGFYWFWAAARKFPAREKGYLPESENLQPGRRVTVVTTDGRGKAPRLGWDPINQGF